MNKAYARALHKAEQQRKLQQASLDRKAARRRANGAYTAMELIAMEAQRGVRYYQGERKPGQRGYSNLDWRDHDNATH